MSERKWHLEHEDGREWADDELAEFVRVEREHDKLWPIDARFWDARFWDLAIGLDGDVYVLDNCQVWHQLIDDAVVVRDKLEPETVPNIPVIRRKPKIIRNRVNPLKLAFRGKGLSKQVGL